MRVLARITPGPSWLPGQTVWEQGPTIADHLAHMRQGYDAGVVLVGGPLRDGMSGTALLEFPNLAAARAFAAADPAVAAGIMTYEVGEVLPYFDALSGLRSGSTTRKRPTEASA